MKMFPNHSMIHSPFQIISVFKDGGVGLYDLKKKNWDFLREKVLDLFTLFTLILLEI